MSEIQTGSPEQDYVSQTVIEAVAEAEGVSPAELHPPLYEVINPEALDCLFAETASIGKVVFNYNSCEVSVFPDGYIAVEKHGM